MKQHHSSLAAPFTNPLCVALDVDSDQEALSLAEELSDIVGGFKVGPRLASRYGSSLLKKISQKAPLFLDCKYFDIPSTMVSAIQAAFDCGASAATIHALSGKRALSQLARLQAELNSVRPFKILAVTILTSWSKEDYSQIFKSKETQTNVLNLVQECEEQGIQNFVCSPEEAAMIKAPNRFLVTPGIRFSDEANDDQFRVANPRQALQAGANLLVVGRPIIKSSNPRKVAAEYLSEVISV